MKFVYLLNARMPTEKAYGVSVATMCGEFALLGAEVELVVPTRRNSISEDVFGYYGVNSNFTIKYISVPDVIQYSSTIGQFAFWIQSIFFMFRVWRERISGDVLYTRNAEIAWIVSGKAKNVLYEAHNFPASKTKLFKYFLKKVTGIVCNSNGTADKFREAGFGEKIVVAPNGVNKEKFSVGQSQEKTRSALGLPQDKKIVMYIGSFYAWKGVGVLLRAWASFAGRPDVHLVLVGGSKENLEEKEVLSELHGLLNVTFVNKQPFEKVPLFEHSADMLILPNNPITEESRLYTSPIKLFEYMASGRPIVASDVPSIREVLNDDNALFFEADNETDLAKKISTLLEEPDRGQRIGTRALEDVAQYTWSKRAEKIWNTIQ